MENSMECPQKIKHRTTKGSSNPTSGYIFEESEIIALKSYLTLMFTAVLFTRAKNVEII